MTYNSNHKWSSGKAIDEQVDQAIFQLHAKDYAWTKTLSIKPRRCFWTNEIIKPFSYAMLAHLTILELEDNSRIAPDAMSAVEKCYPDRWVSMPTYIMLKLKGEL